MRYRANSRTPDNRRGVVLLAVLIVVALLSLAAYQYSEMMMGEYKASVSYTRTAQARAFADSGINYAAILLSDPLLFEERLLGNPYDNPSAFQAIPVLGADGVPQGYFSVISPMGPDDTALTPADFRYGATDEAGKINLNALLRLDRSGDLAVQILTNLAIPEDTANAILDWIDRDETTRPNGAESDFYSLQFPPYRTKNGPLETLEELLFVRGVTADLLFGGDRNRNGVLDPDEQSAGDLGLGWSSYLTVYSREQNIDSAGNPRIYINDNNAQDLFDKLSQAVSPEMAAYIVLYRAYGAASAQEDSSSGGGSGEGDSGGQGSGGRDSPPGGDSRGGRDDDDDDEEEQQQQREVQGDLSEFASGSLPRARMRRRLSSIFELVNTEVVVPGRGDREPARRYASPLNDQDNLVELLPLLFDKATTTRNQDLPARVNVTTAPRQVLLALPGVTESDVEAILSARPDPTTGAALDPVFQTPAWLYTDAKLPVSTLRTLERFVTSQTQVYRVQVLGHFAGGGPSMRVEAIIDTNRGRPRIVYWRDLSELGRGFAVPAQANLQ